LRIALIAPRWRALYGSYRALSREINTTPPLGLGYLAACLRDKGHAATLLDVEVSYADTDSLLEALRRYDPQLVGITATSPVLPEARRLAGAIQGALRVPLLLGGPHVTAVGREALEGRSPFDFGLMGDAERTVVDLVSALESGRDPGKTPGLVVRRDGDVSEYTTYRYTRDLNSLPHPWFGGIEIEKYRWSVPGFGTRIALPIIASRGCPYHCLFCFKDPRRQGVRVRKADDVEAEVSRRLGETPARHFVFVDDYLTYDQGMVYTLCDRFSRMNSGRFTWEGDTRADGVDLALLRKMKRAGMVRINFGVECCDPTVLKRLNKNVDLQTIRAAFGMAKQVGLETRGSFILGNAYETRASVLRTLRFAARMRHLDQPYLNIAMPYPGTRLRELALRGDGGIRLLDPSYENMGRYANAIMEVNDITPAFLVRAQRWGLLWAYIQPFRLRHNLTREGVAGTFRMAAAFAKGLLGARHNGTRTTVCRQEGDLPPSLHG